MGGDFTNARIDRDTSAFWWILLWMSEESEGALSGDPSYAWKVCFHKIFKEYHFIKNRFLWEDVMHTFIR